MNRVILYGKMIERDIRKSIVSVKGFLILIALLFINYQEIHPVVEWAQKQKAVPTPYAMPFIFYDYQFLLLFGMLIIFLFSDVPFINQHTTYILLRIGRRRWLFLQLFKMTIMSILYMGTEILISMACCGNGNIFANKWGNVWNTLSVVPDEVSIAVPRNVLILYTPKEAMLRTFWLGMLVVFLIGCIMLLASLVISNTFAIVSAGILAVFPYVTGNASLISPKIYYFSPISWIGIIEHSKVYIYGGPTSKDMLAIVSLLSMLCILIIYVVIQYVDMKEWKGEKA